MASGDCNSKHFPPLTSTIISKVNHHPLYKSKSFLQQKYGEERLSVTEIAALIFSARNTVVAYLEYHQIPIREEDHVKKKVPPYGKKWRRGQLESNDQESRTAEKIKELRKLGHSYQKVADILNALGLKPRHRKAVWHAKTVRDVSLRD